MASRDGKAFTAEEMAVLRTQDFRYVNLGMAQEKQKIERLKANLPLLADARNDKTKSKGGAALKSNHTVFVDSREEGTPWSFASTIKTTQVLRRRVLTVGCIEIIHVVKNRLYLALPYLMKSSVGDR